MGSSESKQDRYQRDTVQPHLQYTVNTMPDLVEVFQRNKSDILGSVKKPTDLSTYYDKARQNLNYTMGSQVADASSQAGALAASQGLANKGGFVANTAQNVRQSFVPQFGQLESSQALNTAQQQDEFNRYFTNLLMNIGQSEGQARQGMFNNQATWVNLLQGNAQNYDPYSSKDKNMQFGAAALNAGAKMASTGGTSNVPTTP